MSNMTILMNVMAKLVLWALYPSTMLLEIIYSHSYSFHHLFNISKLDKRLYFITQYPWCYPMGLMILSCVMLIHWFVSLVLGHSYEVVKRSHPHSYVPIKQRKPPDPSQNTFYNKVNICRSKKRRHQFKGLVRLALLAALSKASSMPSFSFKRDIDLKNDLKHYKTSFGMLNTQKMCAKADKNLLLWLRSYLQYSIHSRELMNGMFYVLIDSGCSISASPCKDDFIYMEDLKEPIELNGVGGMCK